MSRCVGLVARRRAPAGAGARPTSVRRDAAPSGRPWGVGERLPRPFEPRLVHASGIESPSIDACAPAARLGRCPARPPDWLPVQVPLAQAFVGTSPCPPAPSAHSTLPTYHLLLNLPSPTYHLVACTPTALEYKLPCLSNAYRGTFPFPGRLLAPGSAAPLLLPAGTVAGQVPVRYLRTHASPPARKTSTLSSSSASLEPGATPQSSPSPDPDHGRSVPWRVTEPLLLSPFLRTCSLRQSFFLPRHPGRGPTLHSHARFLSSSSPSTLLSQLRHCLWSR